MTRILTAGLFSLAMLAQADIVEHIGSYSGWDSVEWVALNSLNDARDSSAEPQLDFVGDSSDSGAFWAKDDSYVYFRMRLDVETVDSKTFSDSHFVLIDVDGHGADNGAPDFGFAWDSKSNDPTAHGLEMTVLSTFGTYWSDVTMDDIDGSAGQKLEIDINGAGRSTDGYVRSIDSQGTANFGATTFLDFAVSLNYMNTYTPALLTNGTWKIQFASLADATDHNSLDEDIAGGQSPGSELSTSGWSETIAIPEPAVAALVLLFGGSLLVLKRIFGS